MDLLLRTETEPRVPVRVERCERDRPDIERAEPVRLEGMERTEPESGDCRAAGSTAAVPPSGARPHSSQKPSASMVPEQPARAQRPPGPAVATATGAPVRPVAATSGASPHSVQ